MIRPHRRPTLNQLLGAGAAGGGAYLANVKAMNAMLKEIRKMYPGSTAFTNKKMPKLKFEKRTTLKSDIKKIKGQMNKDMATHTFKQRNTNRSVALENQAGYYESGINTQANLENAMANFRYYNPSTPGTLTTADASTGTYSRDINVNSTFSKCVVRNNYQVPVMVKVYIVRPKSDTNIAPLTQFTNGLTDQGNPTSTSPLIHLSDSDQFNEQYKIVKSKSKELNPGRQFSLTHAIKSFFYDPSNYDSHTLQYQSKQKTFFFIVRTEGVIAHDNVTTTQQGTIGGGVDVCIDTVWKFKYDGGVNLNDITINDTSSTFTSAGVVSNCPVSDNQQYAIN